MVKKFILSGIVGAVFSAFLTYLVVTYALEKGISVRRMMGINAFCGGLGSAFASLIIKNKAEKKQTLKSLIATRLKEVDPISTEAVDLKGILLEHSFRWDKDKPGF